MKPRTRFLRLCPALFSVLTVGLASSALAGSFVWQNSGTTDNWSTAAGDTNWFVDGGNTLAPWSDANSAVLAGGTGETIALIGTVAPTSTTINDNGNWTLNGAGVLGGTGTLTKNGTGTLTLANTTANTYNGTTINGGILAIGTGGTGANTSTVEALGAGAVTINNGGTLKLWIQNSTAFTYANPITINGGTILSEDGTNTVSGPITLGASGATLTSKWDGKNLIASGIISGVDAPVRIAREGGGAIVILTGASTYTGGTTVTAGSRLQLGNDAAFDYGGVGRIRGVLTAEAGSTVLLQGSNALGYNTDAKVNAINLNGATLTHAGNADNGWGVAYTLNGATMRSTTANGRFSFGSAGGTAPTTSVTTVASATTSTIAGVINLRENNPGNSAQFIVDDGAAAVDLLVSANIGGGATFGITKNGTGSMALAGANTYGAATTVNGGTLLLSGSGTLVTSPVILNAAGFTSAAAGKTISALTANTTSSLGLVARTGATTTVTGAYTQGPSAAITVNVLPGERLQAAQVYDLLTAGSIAGTATYTPVFPVGSRIAGTTAVNGNKLQLTVTTGAADLIWNNTLADNTWQSGTVTFLNGASGDQFKTYDAVTFNDNVGAGDKTVTLTGELIPAQVTVNNSTGSYTFAGAGSLTGSGSLVKAGSSDLILGGTMTLALSGDVSVGGTGSLNLGTKTISGLGAVRLTGGTLANGTISASAFDVQSGTSTAVLTGGGSLTKSTAGTATLNAANTYTGGTTVSAGTLVVGSAGALGSGTLTVAGGQVNFDVTGAANRTINLTGGNLAIKLGNSYTSDGAPINFNANNTAVVTYGTEGVANIADYDVNSAALNVAANVTGASVSPLVNLQTGTFGFQIGVGAGGDLTVAGVIAGTGKVRGAAIGPAVGDFTGTDIATLVKVGAGNLILTGASTFAAGADVAISSIQDGTVTVAGGDDRLPATSGVYLGKGTTSGKLALRGVSQTITGLKTVGTGTANAVVGGSATRATLTVNNTNDYIYSGAVGGAGTNENNLGIAKSGPGTLTLSGAYSYKGDTTVSGGTLILGPGTLDVGSDVRLNSSGKLELPSGTQTVARLWIDGVPMAVGKWGKAGTAGIDFADSHFEGPGILNVTNLGVAPGYVTWSTLKGLTPGLNAAKGDDPDEDGLNNLAEFAFDGEPLSATGSGKVASKTTAGGTIFTLPVRRDVTVFNVEDSTHNLVSGSGSEVAYRIQASTDLVSWTLAIAEVPNPSPLDMPDLSVPGPGLPSDWVYRSFKVDAGNSKVFIRAKVEAP